MSEQKEKLLEVKDLGITLFTDRGALPAVQHLDPASAYLCRLPV